LYFLFLIANYIEDRKGFLFTLQIFLFSGAAGMFVYSQSDTLRPFVGASGAIAGMLTYFCFKFSHVRINLFSRSLDFYAMPGNYYRDYWFIPPRQYSLPPELFFLFWLGTYVFAMDF